jgi:hypothetical protein
MPQPNRDEGTSQSDKTDQLERRAPPRRPCDLRTVGEEPGPEGGQTWVGRVENVSTKGLALVLRHQVKLGTVLVLRFQSGDRPLSRPLPVRVMRAQAQGDGSWRHGCAFLRELRECDLDELLLGARDD